MTRANWKLPYVNYILLKQYLYQENFLDKIVFLWNISGRVFFGLINKRVLINRGNSLIKLLIKPSFFNTNLGEYIISKNMGISIHERNKKKKKKKGARKKKGVLANPIGYRLELLGNWEDYWISFNNLTYAEFLHNCLNLKRFTSTVFESESVEKSGILLSHVKIHKTIKYIRVFLTWYNGPKFEINKRTKFKNRKKWYFIFFKKYILFFRIWQMRIFWLRYKFSKMEQKIINLILDVNKSITIYKIGNETSIVKNLSKMKMKYTWAGNQLFSKLFLRADMPFKIRRFLISKEKRNLLILNGNMKRKETNLIKSFLKQKNPFFIKYVDLKQIFNNIMNIKSKRVGLMNTFNKKTLNLWYFILEVCTNENFILNLISDYKLNKFFKRTILIDLNKLLIFLNFLYLRNMKLLKKNSRILKINGNYFQKFFEEVLTKYKNNFKLKDTDISFLKNLTLEEQISSFKKNKEWLDFFVNNLIIKTKVKTQKDISLILFFIKNYFSLIKNKKIISVILYYKVQLEKILKVLKIEGERKFSKIFFNKKKISKIFYKRILGFFQQKKKKRDLSLSFFNYLTWMPRFFKPASTWKNKQLRDYKFTKRIYKKALILRKLKFKKQKIKLGSWRAFNKPLKPQFNKFGLSKWLVQNSFKGYKLDFMNDKIFFKFLQSSALKSTFNYHKERLGPSVFSNIIKKYKRSSLRFWRSKKIQKAYNSSFSDQISMMMFKYRPFRLKNKINLRFLNKFRKTKFETENTQTEKADDLLFYNFIFRITEFTRIKNVFNKIKIEKEKFMPFIVKRNKFRNFFIYNIRTYIDWLNGSLVLFKLEQLKPFIQLRKIKKVLNDKYKKDQYELRMKFNWEKSKLMRKRLIRKALFFGHRIKKKHYKVVYKEWSRLLWICLIRNNKIKVKRKFFNIKRYKFTRWPYFFSVRKALFPSYWSPEVSKLLWKTSKYARLKRLRRYKPLKFKELVRNRSEMKRRFRIRRLMTHRYLRSRGIVPINYRKDKGARLKFRKNRLRYIWDPWWSNFRSHRIIKHRILKLRLHYWLYWYYMELQDSKFFFLLKYIFWWVNKFIKSRKSAFLFGIFLYVKIRKLKGSKNLYLVLLRFMKIIKSVKRFKRVLKKFKKIRKYKYYVRLKLRRVKKKRFKLKLLKNLRMVRRLKKKKLKLVERSLKKSLNALQLKNKYFIRLHQVNFSGDFKNWIVRLLSTKLLLRTKKSFKDFFLIHLKNRVIRFRYIFNFKRFIFRNCRRKSRQNIRLTSNYIYNLRKSIMYYKNNKIFIINKKIRNNFYRKLKRLKTDFKLNRLKKFGMRKLMKIGNKNKKQIYLKKLNKYLKTIWIQWWKKHLSLYKLKQRKSRAILYKLKDLKKWYLYFYFKRHQTPWKGYAGIKYLHKDYGKYIDYKGKGKIGNFIFYYNKIKQFYPTTLKMNTFTNTFSLKKTLKKNKLFLFYFNNNVRRYIFKLNTTRNLFSKKLNNINLDRVRKKKRLNNTYKKSVDLRDFHKKSMYINRRQFRFRRLPSKTYYNYVESKGKALYRKLYLYNNLIKQKWWKLKKIKYKLDKLIKLNSIIGTKSLILKIPRKSLLKIKKGELKIKNLKTKMKKSYLKKKYQIKKIFLFYLKLKQLIINPKIYIRIWNRIDLFFNSIIKNKKNIWFFVKKGINKLEKMKKIIIKQNFVERLRLIFENLIKGRIHLYIINIDNEEVSAELLVRYFLIRLRQSYTIRFMLNPVEKELKKLVKLGYLQGFRIRLSGRFTRRQRSKIIKTKFGIMPLTEKRKKIDFNERTTILKFSILSIRVWLCKTETEQRDFLKNIEFKSLPIEYLMNKVTFKRFSRYSNNFTNYGFYSEINQTLGSFENNTFGLIKQRLKKNKKDLIELKKTKRIIFDRLFTDRFRIYEEGKNFSYENKKFIDSSVRAFLIYKQFKKKKVKNRWESFRSAYIKDQSLYKNRIIRKIKL